MEAVKLDPKKLQELMLVCEEAKGKKGELIHVLHKAQTIIGYLPVEVQQIISEELKIPLC